MTQSTTKEYVHPKQELVFNFIKNYIANNGYAPTQVEIAAALGMKRTLVKYHILELHRKGLVDKRPKKRRNLMI